MSLKSGSVLIHTQYRYSGSFKEAFMVDQMELTSSSYLLLLIKTLISWAEWVETFLRIQITQHLTFGFKALVQLCLLATSQFVLPFHYF